MCSSKTFYTCKLTALFRPMPKEENPAIRFERNSLNAKTRDWPVAWSRLPIVFSKALVALMPVESSGRFFAVSCSLWKQMSEAVFIKLWVWGTIRFGHKPCQEHTRFCRQGLAKPARKQSVPIGWRTKCVTIDSTVPIHAISWQEYFLAKKATLVEPDYVLVMAKQMVVKEKLFSGNCTSQRNSPVGGHSTENV